MSAHLFLHQHMLSSLIASNELNSRTLLAATLIIKIMHGIARGLLLIRELILLERNWTPSARSSSTAFAVTSPSEHTQQESYTFVCEAMSAFNVFS
jgi:hypothetical protein